MARDKEPLIIRVYDYDELYPGRFIKAVAFRGTKPTYRISDAYLEELHGNKGPEMRAIVTFENERQAWVCCKTNGFCMRQMFGKKLSDWQGKRVTLFESQWNGEPCIRVWGSPELAKDMEVIIAHPRKTPFTMTMHAMLPEPAKRAEKPAAASAVTSEACARYFAKMADAQDTAVLQAIEELIAEDNELTAEETGRLSRGLARRKGQLSPEGAAAK